MLKKLQITELTSEVLKIARPLHSMRKLYIQLIIRIIVSVSPFLVIENFFLDSLADLPRYLSYIIPPLIFIPVGVGKIVGNRNPWHFEFNKTSNEFSLNSVFECKLEEIKAITLHESEKKQGNSKWIHYELSIITQMYKKVVLATSNSTVVVGKLADCISSFLNIELTTNVKERELDAFTKTKMYKEK